MDDMARLAHWHRLSADAADRQMTRAGRTAWSKADRALADYVLALLTDPRERTKAANPHSQDDGFRCRARMRCRESRMMGRAPGGRAVRLTPRMFCVAHLHG